LILETLRKRQTTLNVHEVASLFGLSESLVYRMAARGQLPMVRFSGALRFDPSKLANWYESRLQKSFDITARSSNRSHRAR
jgi:excisionase family DNA binding protein